MKTRNLFILFALFAAPVVPAQSPTSPQVAPVDIIVTLKEHQTGAELVEMRLIQRNFPKPTLEQRIGELGRLLGASIRGLQIRTIPLGNASQDTVLKANFATDNLIEPGKLNLQPILQAFTGIPAPNRVSNFQILLDGQSPTGKTVRKVETPGVVVAEAIYSQQPRGIEYRVRVETDDPAKVVFPASYDAPKAQEKASAPNVPGDNRPLIIGLFAVVGLSLGALVYLAMLRGGGSRRA
jgi:hypothetical protein